MREHCFASLSILPHSGVHWRGELPTFINIIHIKVRAWLQGQMTYSWCLSRAGGGEVHAARPWASSRGGSQVIATSSSGVQPLPVAPSGEKPLN